MQERMMGACQLGQLHYCGRRHRTWSGIARCILGEWRPRWIMGQGEWATLAYCPPGLTVMLHATREAAEQVLARIDRTGCGGRCEERHYLRLLASARSATCEEG